MSPPARPAKGRMHVCIWLVLFLVTLALTIALAAVLVMQEGPIKLKGFRPAAPEAGMMQAAPSAQSGLEAEADLFADAEATPVDEASDNPFEDADYNPFY